MSEISERIRAYVNDPTVAGDYGAWGALRPDQRGQIRALCDLCDAFERIADTLAEARHADFKELKQECEYWKAKAFGTQAPASRADGNVTEKYELKDKDRSHMTMILWGAGFSTMENCEKAAAALVDKGHGDILDALNMISGQMAQIQHLKSVIEVLLDQEKTARAEAFKEFAERLKREAFMVGIPKSKPLIQASVVSEIVIDELLKELTGGAET